MLLPIVEKSLASVLAIGAAFTTVFIVSGSVSDPVNAPKLLILGITSALALGFLLPSFRRAFSDSIWLWVASIAFLIFGLVSTFTSSSPVSQNFYGSYGRNNGYFAYLFLTIVLLATALLRQRKNLAKIVKALFVAGILNVLYCFWVIIFGDFVGWSNPYGNILGTFGNPNFVGAFLGIFFAVYLGYGVSSESPKWFKLSLLLVLPLTAFEIYDSSAIQGRVVGIGGMAIVGFLYLRSRFSRIVIWAYSLFCAAIGTLGLLGALQIGPLTSLIYKTSVSLRGQYWLAGWNSGQSHPFNGVGMDAFGDWYRRTRDPHALELPGVNTVVNAAHNVPLDMFAFGGWPLFLSYLMIMALGGRALLKTLMRTKSYDPIFAVISAGWIGYQVQSIISINQIGLAIWGWILTGAAIAYERISIEDPNSAEKKKSARTLPKDENQYLKSLIVASAVGVIGLLIALPPLTADSKWRSAQVSQNANQLANSMVESYFNPHNSTKFLANVQAFEQANLTDLAHKYAIEAVKWNPESFDLWKVLYLIQASTAEEKALAIENMKRLDPLNPDVTAR
jgi:hypothetical protein